MNEKNFLDENEVETEEGAGVVLELLEGSEALSAVDRAAIDIQVATAKQYPRSVDKALKEALTLATLDEDTAASMFYALPRGGKTIEGPSARLAEVMTYAWGNLRADADIVAEDRTHVTAMGTCFDVERNIAVRVRVKRRITDRHGRRYNEDMIGVTANAAISIALRNAVFKVVPMAFVRRIYGAARKASLGEAGTITQKRQKALEWFANAGVKDAQVFDVLGVKGLDDIGEDELITLRGFVTALKDGDTTIEQVFRRHDVSDGAGELNDALEEKPVAEEPAGDDTPALPGGFQVGDSLDESWTLRMLKAIIKETLHSLVEQNLIIDKSEADILLSVSAKEGEFGAADMPEQIARIAHGQHTYKMLLHVLEDAKQKQIA